MSKNKKSISSDSEKDIAVAEEIKIVLSKEESARKKIQLLTTVPINWDAAKIHRMLGATRYMTKTALKIRQTLGYGAAPNLKKGHSLSSSVINIVKKFYESDENSRLMPGKKDCISIVINEKRESVQKRLLLCNLKDLHSKFF